MTKQKRLLGLESIWSCWPGKGLSSLAPKSYGKGRDSNQYFLNSAVRRGKETAGLIRLR